MKKVLLFSTLILAAGLSVSAIELEPGKIALSVESLKGSSSDYIESSDFLAQDDDIMGLDEEDKTIYEYKYKSPKKAFIYSLIVPGLGQRYAGSGWIKPIIYFAVEVGSWAGYIKYHGDGNDKTDEFKAFADMHWAEGDTTGSVVGDPYPNLTDETYRGWLLINYGNVADTNKSDFTETLPDTKTQQYYEMIGKYDQFRGGWDDYWTGDTATTYVSPNRNHYVNLRKDANDLLDKANTLIIVAMANHIISAFEAAISANRHNKQIADDTWSFKAEVKRYAADENIPMLMVRHRF